MGWLWLVDFLKLDVPFAEYSLFYRALLQKRPIILSILLTKATPTALMCYMNMYVLCLTFLHDCAYYICGDICIYAYMHIYKYVCVCVYSYIYVYT